MKVEIWRDGGQWTVFKNGVRHGTFNTRSKARMWKAVLERASSGQVEQSSQGSGASQTKEKQS